MENQMRCAFLFTYVKAVVSSTMYKWGQGKAGGTSVVYTTGCRRVGWRHHAALRLWVHLETCEGVKRQVTQPPCHLLQPQSLICFWLHLVFLSPHHLLTFLALMSELATCTQNSSLSPQTCNVTNRTKRKSKSSYSVFHISL